MLPLTLAQSAVADKTTAMQTTLAVRARTGMALLDMISLLFSLWGKSPYWMVMGTLTLVWYWDDPVPAVPVTTTV
jgi:hypothetical protein